MWTKKQLTRNKGFTLVEVMIVVVIIGILSAIAIPTFLTWLPGYRLKNAVKELKDNFQIARFEAIKRGGGGVHIEFFPVAAAVPRGRAGSYVVFIDSDGDQSFNPALGDISVNQVTMPDDVSMTSVTYGSNGAGNPVMSFQSRGLPNALGRVIMTNLNIWGRLTMNVTGRVQVERNGDGNPPWDDWD